MMASHADGRILGVKGVCQLAILDAIQQNLNMVAMIEDCRFIGAVKVVYGNLVGPVHHRPVFYSGSGQGAGLAQLFILDFGQGGLDALLEQGGSHSWGLVVADIAPVGGRSFIEYKAGMAACAFPRFLFRHMAAYAA